MMLENCRYDIKFDVISYISKKRLVIDYADNLYNGEWTLPDETMNIIINSQVEYWEVIDIGFIRVFIND